MNSETCLGADVFPRWLHGDRKEDVKENTKTRRNKAYRSWISIRVDLHLLYARGNLLGIHEARFNAESSGKRYGSHYKWELGM